MQILSRILKGINDGIGTREAPTTAVLLKNLTLALMGIKKMEAYSISSLAMEKQS
jgi:hypothetical protein